MTKKSREKRKAKKATALANKGDVIAFPLLVGWNTTTDWLLELPQDKPATNIEDLMVKIPAKALTKHTLVVGQSGSGKSVFLGRLIEEVMLRTRARCVIVDPNAEYMQLHTVNPNVWTWGKPWYTEDTRETFEQRWKRFQIDIKTAPAEASVRRDPGGPPTAGVNPQFFWHELNADLVAAIVIPEDNAPLRRTVSIIHAFIGATGKAYLDDLKAREQARKSRSKEPQMADEGAKEEPITNVCATAEKALPKKSWEMPVNNLPDLEQWGQAIGDAATTAWERYKQFVAICTTRYPFSIKITAKGLYEAKTEMHRLDVLDITSIDNLEVRALATSALLLYEWDRSRALWQTSRQPTVEFYPTLLVIDEAHNLIPRELTNSFMSVLRDQVRTIAAEGRKYGLALILCTQRPDKIDARIVSECQNVAILRMVSDDVLNDTCNLLGINLEAAKPCLNAQPENGFGMLFGEWAGNQGRDGKPFKGAAQRTLGSVKLNEDWLKDIAETAPTS
jgi:Helicase HerA, central domain